MNTEKKLNRSEAQQFFAIEFNNQTWGLLDKQDRQAQEADLMLHAAHASYIHWLSAGNEVNRQRGAWLLARVYAELGLADRAQHYAAECEALTSTHKDKMADFDLFYVQEALARSHAVGENPQSAAPYYDAARKALEAIAAEEDRKIAAGDLKAGNWGSFTPA